MSVTLIVGILVAAGIITAITSWLLTKREFAKRFLSRPALEPHDVVSGFDPNEAQFLTELWPKLEKLLGVPPGRLRLTDRFNVELRANSKIAIYQPAGDVLEDLGSLFPQEHLNVSTVRDYCECALRLRRRSPQKDVVKVMLG